MKVSYNWLKDLVPGLDISPAELAETLTMHAFETEVAGAVELDENIIVAKVMKLEAHPDADRLQLATIDTGEEEVTVVCGAPNIAEGQVVPFSPPGTVLRDDTGETFTLKPTAIRGVESPGMLNSPRELGLGESHEGIYLLPADTPLGSKLNEHIPADTILDIDMTPNRAHDSMSHRGVAREIAALLGLGMEEPELEELATNELSEWSLAIESDQDTPAYNGVLLEGLTVKPSPLWLQARLWSAGMKPINNIVDITNYVMLELGNPTHAFDAERLPGKAIGVRRARDGEKLTTLDGAEHTLVSDNLVITSDDTPVALAGVMGGGESEVTSETTQVFLEIANFHPFVTWKSTVAAKLNTEGSSRWVKGVPQSLATEATRRCAQLLREFTGATVVGSLHHGADEIPARTVSFDPARVSSMAGVTIDSAEAKRALERLRFSVDDTKNPWQVTVPLERLDVIESHDLVEEVIRIVGLETIEASSAAEQATPVSLPDHVWRREVVRDALRNMGFTETYSASFEPASFAAKAGVADEDHIAVVNPPAPELKNLRVSLLPGLLANLVRNRELLQRNAGRKEGALFEIGHVYHPGEGGPPAGEARLEGGQVPGVIEQEKLAGVIVGGAPSLTAVAEGIGQALGVDSPQLANKLTDEIVRSLKFRMSVAAFEISLGDLLRGATSGSAPVRTLDELRAVSEAHTTYAEISKFPATYRDISLLVKPQLTVEQVQEVIERVGGELVVDVDLFDEYEPADRDEKGLAFHVTYQAFDHTLSSDEVAELHNKIITTLYEELGAELRE